MFNPGDRYLNCTNSSCLRFLFCCRWGFSCFLVLLPLRLFVLGNFWTLEMVPRFCRSLLFISRYVSCAVFAWELWHILALDNLGICTESMTWLIAYQITLVSAIVPFSAVYRASCVCREYEYYSVTLYSFVLCNWAPFQHLLLCGGLGSCLCIEVLFYYPLLVFTM